MVADGGVLICQIRLDAPVRSMRKRILSAPNNSYLIRMRFWVRLQVPATILKIIEERIGRRVLDNEQRSYFVTCFAFARLVLGYAPLLLKLGVCCKSLI